MKFGIYAPIPMATVGSHEIAQSAAQAQFPLPEGLRDVQYEYGSDLLIAADAAGFELCLFAERHLGEDLAGAKFVRGALRRVRHGMKQFQPQASLLVFTNLKGYEDK